MPRRSRLQLAALDHRDAAIASVPHAGNRLLPATAVVWLLGLSQIIGYGTLYYNFAILAHSAAPSLGWSESWLFAALSAGLLLGGIVAPEVGKRIDRHSAGAVMALGSGIAAAALLIAGIAANGTIFALAIVVTQVAGALVLYDAAFTALVQVTGAEARRRITHLTLIAGFASTIFWPLTSWLEVTVGWRNVFIIFAVANLVVCVPIHAMLARLTVPSGTVDSRAILHQNPVPSQGSASAMWFATAGFALTGFALAAILAQMVPLLTAAGVGSSALVVATLFGPAQVLVRFVNLVVGAGRHPIGATLLALAMVPAAIATLALGAPTVIAAMMFGIMLGFGSGLKSIVQGSLPLALFGSGGYGARLGIMASVRQVLASVAPFALASLIEAYGVRPALWIIGGIGLLGFLCLVQVARSIEHAR